MAKVFDCRFSWEKSVSADVVKTRTTLVSGGTTSTTELGGEVDHFDLTFSAMSSGTFSVVVIDSDGVESISQSINWSVGDGEAPAPVTNLNFAVLQIRDVPEPTPA